MNLGSTFKRLSAASLVALVGVGAPTTAVAETKPPVVRAYSQQDLLSDIVANGRKVNKSMDGQVYDRYNAAINIRIPKTPFEKNPSAFYEGEVTLVIKDVGADFASAGRFGAEDKFQMSYNGDPLCGNCFLETEDYGMNGFNSAKDSVMNRLFPGGGAWRGDSPDPKGKQYYDLLLNAVLDARARGVPIEPDQ